jgi:stage V sporulation protein R
VHNGIPLAEKSRDQVLKHLRVLWGYEVSLEGIDAEDGKQIYETCTAKSEATEQAA